MKPCHGCGGPKTGAGPRDWYCLECKSSRVWRPEAGRTRAPHKQRELTLAELIASQDYDIEPQRFRDASGRRVRVATHHGMAVRLADAAYLKEWEDPVGDAVVAREELECGLV